MNATTVLLTGANGLLGQKIMLLADRFAARGSTLVGTGRGPARGTAAGKPYEEADITDPARWEALFAQYRPQALLHTAALTMVDDAEDKRDECDAYNVTAVAMLADLCKKYNTHFIHISTDFIFDGTSGPYREEDTPNPLGYYGQSKLRAEEIVLASGTNHAILRTMLLYGYTPGMSRSNIVLWVKKSLEDNKTIKVVDDQIRCPTLVEDLAEATVLAWEKHATGIYHVSGAESMPILALAQRVARFFGLDESLIQPTDSASLNQRAKRPPITGFVIDKAQKELDYQPHSLEEGLKVLQAQLLA